MLNTTHVLITLCRAFKLLPRTLPLGFKLSKGDHHDFPLKYKTFGEKSFDIGIERHVLIFSRF
jgi:hypothetical protein